MKELETKALRSLSVEELEVIANTLATRLLALDSIRKNDHPDYERVAGELYHVAQLIDEKETQTK